MTLAADDALSQSADFDIAPQAIEPALHEWSRQSNVQVMVASDEVTGQRTDGVKGRLTAASALARLLHQTNLTYEAVGDNTVTVKRVAAVDPTGSKGGMPEQTRSQEKGASNDSESDNRAKRAIEEVIVTAQKREERLQDVPISISVLEGDYLDKSTVSSAAEALVRVPAVSMNPAETGAQIVVRGVSAGLNRFSGASPTAFYLDSVPFGMSKSALAPDPDIYDLQRIEALRGPQGTLYGANALNGVVRVLTNKADLNSFQLKARTSGSSTDGGGENFRGDLAVNVPIVKEKLAVRAVLGYQDLSGWIDTPIEADVNDAERRNGRVKVNAQPSEHLSIELAAWSSRTDSGAPSGADDAGNRRSRRDESVGVDYDAYTMQLGYELPHFSILSMTSYLDYVNSIAVDVNPSAPAGLLRELSLPVEGLSQEVLLNSTHAGSWRWSAGTMYRDSEDRLEFITEGDRARYRDSTTSESYAVFGEITKIFSDGKFELTGGLRYFEDDVELQEVSRSSGIQTNLLRHKTTFSATTPRLVATWHPDRQMTMYASYSEGFRSGAYQSPAIVQLFPNFPQARPDSLRNYELGVKKSLMEGRLNIEAAAFYIDWQDVQQLLVVTVAGISDQRAVIVNGESASGLGAEFALTARPIDALELGLNFSWNDLTLDSDVFSAGALLFEKGDRLSWSPEYTAGVSADYAFPLGSALEGVFSVAANYISESHNKSLSTGRAGAVENDAMSNIRASAAIRSRDHWTATVFVENLSNEQSSPARNPAFPDWSTRVRPRTVGLQIEYSY